MSADDFATEIRRIVSELVDDMELSVEAKSQDVFNAIAKAKIAGVPGGIIEGVLSAASAEARKEAEQAVERAVKFGATQAAQEKTDGD